MAHRQGELASRRLLRDLREALLGATVERVKLGEILLTIEGGRSPLAEDRPPGEGERAVLKVSAVRPDRFVPKESKTLAEETEMPERARVRRGDVLITRANTAALVGAVCQVGADHTQLFLSDKTLRLTLDGERVDDRYLIHALTTRAARQQIARLATGTSASMKNISQQKLKLVELPLSGLDQQRFAVATLDAVSAVMREHANTLAAVESLRSQVTDAVLRQEFLPGEVMAGGELAPAAI